MECCPSLSWHFSYSNGVVESLIVKSKKIDTLFICIYRPPSTTIDEWKDVMDKISDAIDMAQSNGSYSNIICSGDFNFKSVKWSEGIMDYEVGMCSQAEILATFMRN